MLNVKVENFTSPNGNKVPNQFKIYTPEGVYFRSYHSNIAFIRTADQKIFLDSYYWDYSQTTGKYRNVFLGESTTETRKKIESGEYTLMDLNS